MNNIELTALTELVAAERFLMEADNTILERQGCAPAYDGNVDWPALDRLEAELKERRIIP